jgi:hypothetical protein
MNLLKQSHIKIHKALFSLNKLTGKTDIHKIVQEGKAEVIELLPQLPAFYKV